MFNYYAPVVYANTMGLSRNLSLILGGCTSLTCLAASFIPLWTVEKFGRPALLMFSAAGLCFCFSMVSILLSIGTRSTAYAATAFVFIFQIFLGIGWLAIPWFYPSEVTTTRISSRGQALGAFVNWMCIFTVVQITPIAIGSIDWRPFIVFAVFCQCWVPIVYCFFPETNQLKLEDIDHLFESGYKITRGLFRAKGGRTVEAGWHQRARGLQAEKGEDELEGMGEEMWLRGLRVCELGGGR